MYKDTTATQRIFKLTKKIRAVSGGTSASKTISILIWLIDYAQSTKNKVVTVVGESVPHLNLGAKRDFKNIMVANGYWIDASWSESGVYTFPNGTIIEFISFDKFGKAHGPRRDVLFLNEANYLPYDIADQLITRTRSVVWLDWNPSSEFWFYTEMLGKRPLDFIGDKGNYPPLTYKDNEALDKDSIIEIESHTNPQWRKVYIDGKLGEIEGRVFTGWEIIDEIPHQARLERHGLDFGFSQDPAVIVDVFYFNGGIILDQVLYQKGLHNRDLANALKNLKPALTIADSAEPKSISEIQQYGISIIPCEKGKDSKKYGIGVMQDQRISVTKRSVELIKEYRNYLWATDREGRLTGETDGADDAIDASRYALTSLIPVIQRKEFAANQPRFFVERKRAMNRAR